MEAILDYALGACAILLAAGAGWQYARQGVNLDKQIWLPVVLAFLAFIAGSEVLGSPDAEPGSFQPRVWLTLGGAVLAGFAIGRLAIRRASRLGGSEDVAAGGDRKQPPQQKGNSDE